VRDRVHGLGSSVVESNGIRCSSLDGIPRCHNLLLFAFGDFRRIEFHDGSRQLGVVDRQHGAAGGRRLVEEVGGGRSGHRNRIGSRFEFSDGLSRNGHFGRGNGLREADDLFGLADELRQSEAVGIGRGIGNGSPREGHGSVVALGHLGG